MNDTIGIAAVTSKAVLFLRFQKYFMKASSDKN